MSNERPTNVLMVDDEPANLLAYEAVLQGLDANLIRANSGQEALRFLLQNDAAVILMDVNMPGLDGFETAHLIRLRPRSQYTPLIFITAAYKDDLSKFEGYAVGAVDYLEKPVNADILRSKVAVFLKLYQVTALRQQIDEMSRAADVANTVHQAKSLFLSRLSHEMRTPLNRVLGMTEIVLDSPLTHEQRKSLETVSTSAHSLLAVLNDLFDYAKLDSGQCDLNVVRFQMRDSLNDTGQRLHDQATQKRLHLAWHIASDIPETLWGDPIRFRQMIVNLVGNAIKFTKQGEVVVNIDLETQTAEEVCLHVAVRDTGIGVPADRQPLIFQPFVQADDSLTRTYGGTGLGLAIASRLAERMQGRIWMESNVPQGSTFHFTARFERHPEDVLSPTSEPPAQLQDQHVMVGA